MKFIIICIALLCSLESFAGLKFSAPVVVTATGTSTQVMAGNSFRSYLIIQNTGANSVSVKFGSVQATTEGVVIPAGGAYEPIQAPGNSVWLISLSSTSAVTLIQGQ